MVSLITFEVKSFVKGYHAYQYDWSTKVDEVLKAKIEPTNIVDKYALCVLHDRVVGHLKLGKSGRFAKTVFYFLRADAYSSSTVIIKGKAVNLGDGEGMQVPCKLKFIGQKKYVEILQKELKNWITNNRRTMCIIF